MDNNESGIVVKDDQKILDQSRSLVEVANSFKISTDLDLQKAVEIEKTLKLFLDGPGKYHDEEIEAANKLHKMLCKKRNAITEHVKKAWKSLKDRRAQYQYEQEKKRQEAQRRAEEEARRKEAEKQAKIQAKIDAENAKAAAAKNAEAKRRAEERAAALREKKENVYVQTKQVAPVSQPRGASFSYEYVPTVVNKELVPETYKIVDLAMLKKMQKAAKGKLDVPGVRFEKRAVGSLRGVA